MTWCADLYERDAKYWPEAGAGCHIHQYQRVNKVKSVVCVVGLVSVLPSIQVGQINPPSSVSSHWELMHRVQSAVLVEMTYLG